MQTHLKEMLSVFRQLNSVNRGVILNSARKAAEKQIQPNLLQKQFKGANTTMEERGMILAQERHDNISMLSELLEKVREYNQLTNIRDAKKAKVNQLEQQLRTPAPVFKFNLIKLILCVITFGIGLIVMIVLHALAKNKWKNMIADTEIALRQARKELATAEQIAQDYYNEKLKSYIDTIVPHRFPAQYATNAYALENMITFLNNMRADTIKETVNLYEDMIFHINMENILTDIAHSTASTAQSSARSAAASERSAAANEAAAVAAASTAASMASVAHSQARQAAATERMANR